MAKLIKIVVLLALIAGGIALAVHYASREKTDNRSQQPSAKKDGMQPQEKYGFAPLGTEE